MVKIMHFKNRIWKIDIKEQHHVMIKRLVIKSLVALKYYMCPIMFCFRTCTFSHLHK